MFLYNRGLLQRSFQSRVSLFCSLKSDIQEATMDVVILANNATDQSYLGYCISRSPWSFKHCLAISPKLPKTYGTKPWLTKVDGCLLLNNLGSQVPMESSTIRTDSQLRQCLGYLGFAGRQEPFIHKNQSGRARRTFHRIYCSPFNLYSMETQEETGQPK